MYDIKTLLEAATQTAADKPSAYRIGCLDRIDITKPKDGCHSNLASTYHTLIKLTGKFVEHYASDLLYEIENIENALKNDSESTTLFIGLRQSGVDGISYITGRLSDSLESYDIYRKLLAVTICHDTESPEYRIVTTYDITQIMARELHALAKASS